MKKLYLFLFVFVLQASLSFAGSIVDYYPAQTLGTWCFDSKWASKFMGYTGKNNELSKAFKEAAACLKERISIDIEKDFGKIGVFMIPGGGSFTSVAVFTGNFNTKNNISLVEKALSNLNNQEAKLETISVNGKKVKSFNDGVQSIIFYDDSAILYCYNTALEELKSNRITFTKAPDDFAEMIKKTDSFLYISKAVAPLLGMLRVPPQLVENVSSLKVYVDNNDFVRIEIAFTDPDLSKQICDLLKNLVDVYKGYYAGDFEKNKRNLKDNSISNMPETILSMYTGAKAKDLVDSLELSVNGNAVVISTKFEAFKIILGIVGGVGNVLMKSPHFANARSNARLKACFSNQRVMQGAVEMYNMDHSTMMTTLDIDTLVNEKYLKTAPSGPEPDCKYTTVGDLTDDGYISCVKHGSPFEPHQHSHPHPQPGKVVYPPVRRH